MVPRTDDLRRGTAAIRTGGSVRDHPRHDDAGPGAGVVKVLGNLDQDINNQPTVRRDDDDGGCASGFA
jgi:hypothetical protein